MKANISKIKELCKERGISVSFICEKVGQGAYYLNDVKRRGGDIPDDRLSVIAETLGTTPEYLRDETDDPSPKQKKPAAISDELWELLQQDPFGIEFLQGYYQLDHEQRIQIKAFWRNVLKGGTKSD